MTLGGYVIVNLSQLFSLLLGHISYLVAMTGEDGSFYLQIAQNMVLG